MDDDYSELIQKWPSYRAPDVNVVRFFTKIFWPRVQHVFFDQKISLLEVGCGISSLFADQQLAHLAAPQIERVHSVDISRQAIDFMKTQNLPLGDQHVFECEDVTHKAWLHCFELVLDSSCFHCLCAEGEQVRYLKQVRRALAPSGLFFLQSMVLPKKLGLEVGHEIDPQTGVVYREEKAWRRLIEAQKVEKMLIDAGFEIEFFQVPPHEKAILSQERPLPMSSDPDIVRVIARAPL